MSMIIGFHLNINYFEFRAFADGMYIIMIAYSLLLALKNKRMPLFIYSLFILSAVLSFHLEDSVHKAGKTETFKESFDPELVLVCSILYMLFICSQFKISYKDSLFIKYSVPYLFFCTITLLTTYTLKVNHHLEFLKMLYILANIVCSYFIIGLLYKMYQLKFLINKYFIAGSIAIFVGHYIRVVIGFSKELESLGDFDRIFTFRNTYAQISAIIESVLIFISISETHRLDEEERKALHQQIIEDFNKKAITNQNFLVLQKALYYTLQQQITQNLNKIVSHAHQVKVSLNSFFNTETNRRRIDEMIELSNIGIANLRSIIRNLTQNDEEHSLLLKLQNAISESIAYQKTSVDLYVSPSEVVLDRESERQTIGALRKVLSILPQQQNKVLINISVSDELQMLVQSEITQEYIPKAKRKADEAKYFMDKNNHRFDYFFDDGEISTYQVSIPLFIHHN